MSLEFKNIKRSTSSKRKLMLWIDISVIEAFEGMGLTITVQEQMRQVLQHFVDGGFDVDHSDRPPMRPIEQVIAENAKYDDLEGL